MYYPSQTPLPQSFLTIWQVIVPALSPNILTHFPTDTTSIAYDPSEDTL